MDLLKKQKGQTIAEYVMMLAVSLLIVIILMQQLKEPFQNVVGEYSKNVKKAIETGDVQFGHPKPSEGQSGRFQHE
ncbi:MAG: hypothetical protein HYS98_04590 [Deltaproteobacteria bacterium]|nr:hypothetical protein [Deltaproteobacteria bacterium]